MIDGVTLRECVVREDERGWLTEFYSVNMGDEDLCHVYASMARPGVAKAFHAHLKQADRFVCIAGTAKIGMVDLRGPLFSASSSGYRLRQREAFDWPYLAYPGPIKTLGQWANTEESVDARDEKWMSLFAESATFLAHQTVILSSERPVMLTIPPGVAHGQCAIGGEQSVILNAPTVAFNRDAPDELRMPADSFSYQWGVESK